MAMQITIRDVPNDVRDELAARAALAGRSMQEYLLAQLASRPSPEVLLARIRERKRLSETALSADELVASRDEDRR
jgi:plasmid stability protein